MSSALVAVRKQIVTAKRAKSVFFIHGIVASFQACRNTA